MKYIYSVEIRQELFMDDFYCHIDPWECYYFCVRHGFTVDGTNCRIAYIKLDDCSNIIETLAFYRVDEFTHNREFVKVDYMGREL